MRSQNLLREIRLFITYALITTISFLMHADANNSTQTATDIQLRGIFQIGDKFSFSLKHESRSEWGMINQTVFAHKLISFFPDSCELVLLNSQGNEIVIQLEKSDNVTLEVVSDKQVSYLSDQDSEFEAIDPDTLREVHLVSAKEKIHYQISSRLSNQGSSSLSAANIQSNQPKTSKTTDSTETSTDFIEEESNVAIEESPPLPYELTDLEKIALLVYEKHYVPVREPPADVEVFYTVSPR